LTSLSSMQGKFEFLDFMYEWPYEWPIEGAQV